MARNYYALVAGLREYTLESDKKGFDAAVIIDEIREELGKKDKKYLELFYAFYDITNILNIMRGREQFSTLGNFTREELEKEIKAPENLPRYMADILSAYAEPENPEYDEIDHTKAIEKSLFEAYYDQCAKSGNRFIRDWYGFDRNLRNVSAAFTARRTGIPVAEPLVGEGYVAESIARSSASDFGLKGELDYMDELVEAVGEEGNLLEKEHKIDMIRWEMAEELTTFDDFNMNAILAYLVKINIVQRWVALDPGLGKETFRRLVASFSGRDMIKQAEKQYEK